MFLALAGRFFITSPPGKPLEAGMKQQLGIPPLLNSPWPLSTTLKQWYFSLTTKKKKKKVTLTLHSYPSRSGMVFGTVTDQLGYLQKLKIWKDVGEGISGKWKDARPCFTSFILKVYPDLWTLLFA